MLMWGMSPMIIYNVLGKRSGLGVHLTEIPQSGFGHSSAPSFSQAVLPVSKSSLGF